VRVVKDPATGKYVAKVVDAKGNDRIADGQATPMTIPQLVAEMSESSAYAPAFKGSGASGSGTPPNVKTPAGAVKTVAATDTAGFLANLDAIAKGEVKVTA
jgi:hypothetical protein